MVRRSFDLVDQRDREVRVRELMEPLDPEMFDPPRVEYELTPLGRSLLEPLAAARTWCDKHLPELVEARQAHERRGTEAN
jgi:DNA-binding HxlR family transcriptional regulator